MARTYGAIQTGTPYTTATINLSDYGAVINDNSTTLATSNSTVISPTVRLLKLISDALTDVGVTNSVRIFVNSNSDIIYSYPTLSFVYDGNEYLLLINHKGSGDSNTYIDLAVRKNSNTITMRPGIPASTNIFYAGSQTINKSVQFWFGQTTSDYWYNDVFRDVMFNTPYGVSIQCVVDSSRNVLTILGKSTNNHLLYISIGKHGDANAVLGDISVLEGLTISGGSANTARIFSDADDSLRELLSALGPQTRTTNSSSTVLAFPVYIVKQMENSEFVGTVSSIAVYPDLMLATSNEPNITAGTRFADGTWLCVCSHSSDNYGIQSAILIPWGGNSVPSVFD